MVKNTGESIKQFANWQVPVKDGKVKWVVGSSCIQPQELGKEREVSKRDPVNEQDESTFYERLQRVEYKIFPNNKYLKYFLHI